MMYSWGYGCGSGDGSGYGYGCGSRCGDGDGDGYGDGDGDGYRYGIGIEGDGRGNEYMGDEEEEQLSVIRLLSDDYPDINFYLAQLHLMVQRTTTLKKETK